MAFVGNKLLGVDVTRTSTTQEHELGTIVIQNDGSVYRYVKAAEAIAAYKPVDYTAAFSASVTDDGDLIFGVAQVAIASASYGWILERGVGKILVTALMAAGKIGQISAVGGLGNAAAEATAGDGTRGLTYAAEASTPAGVSAILF